MTANQDLAAEAIAATVAPAKKSKKPTVVWMLGGD
jgi:hypothetical protein